MRLIIFSLALICLSITPSMAQQNKEPKPPKALADMTANGSQIFYLGNFEGMNGWALIRQGKPEFFYENKDRTAMVMGLMFNDAGEMITMAQMKNLYDRIGDDMYAATGGPISSSESNTSTTATAAAPQSSSADTTTQPNRPLSKGELMFVDVLSSNWITINPEGQHDVFAFIDPNCPHCKQFLRDAEPFLTDGGVRIRAIPIGTNPDSLGKSAVLLASANPAERLLKYAAGDTSVLSAPDNINTSAVESNLSVMTKHGFGVTPIIVYRTNKQQIRIVQGRPASIDMLVNDIVNN